ncbi:NUDIX hydrolase [Flavihumibacter petaseus]|uniref:Putative hydrolase n=1 Tax=Flavihumibacter petaseus NBRC 106054 TaxID=1220578 RepID=A0A0E9N3H7_9BACT|nr:NUDIX domain-containing protein [Flavihumibacter petaseus]GAO44358.1 putative hydrolase [Flavihumibacter petaseus NBRC 106054]
MYIKIYFGDKPLFLCDEITPDLEPFLHHDDAVYIDEFSSPAIKSMIYEMQLPGIHAGILRHNDLELLRKAVWKKFHLVAAGGGAVWNDQQQLLFIHRRGKWDLPKGKWDDGESIRECAVREVREETGISAVIRQELPTTFHTYYDSGKHILKPTYWFEMDVTGNTETKVQTEEDIHLAEWLAREEWSQVLNNTFPSIKDVLQALSSG